MNLHSGRASVAMLRMMGCANGRSARNLLHSDCVVDEKSVVLQKKENEGFGFVLRGAKGRHHPKKRSHHIHVNQENVVKVGHRQVVNMIRHGTNRLLIKVVTISLPKPSSLFVNISQNKP
ncbi:hypothetical protein F7725_025953 [Dissostichus mawsoni]|uniref:PDZ domain-containing protein n=1 Tax=Dissostichus mawsoni TaxID=36200 RepID=A0A7J5X770_DISMA|nr:hypothetical protein F7725_025953 [Dissostichus mawsoni]